MTTAIEGQEVVLDYNPLERAALQDVMRLLLKSDKAFALDKFMEEPITIRVHDTQDEFEDKIVSVIVNGTLMPIPRAMSVVVKRKYVEALARAKEVRYRQQTPNPMEPDKMQMVGRVVLKYPFDVLKDASPHGRAWLDAILNEPI